MGIQNRMRGRPVSSERYPACTVAVPCETEAGMQRRHLQVADDLELSSETPSDLKAIQLSLIGRHDISTCTAAKRQQVHEPLVGAQPARQVLPALPHAGR